MTHEKYDELQKKMEQLYSDFIDLGADTEERDEDMIKVSEWVDDQMDDIFKWANDHDAEEKVLAELRSDCFKLKGMLLC